MKKSIVILFAAVLGLGFFLHLKKPVPVMAARTELKTNWMRDIITFDPRMATDSDSMQIALMLFSGLTAFDERGEVVLNLAKSYTVTEDQKTYRFTLHSAQWSDGSPLTAYDFEESWKEYTRDDFPGSLWEMVSVIRNERGVKERGSGAVGIRALDDKTLEIQLEKPTSYFLQLLARPTLFPVHRSMRGAFLEKKKSDPTAIVCSGPFKIQDYQDQVHIVFAKNALYRNAATVALEKIHMSRITDAQTALALFEKKELDWLGQPLSELPVDALADLKGKNLLQSHPLLDVRFLYFNTQTFPFHNAKLRKAFSLAINREAILRDVLQTEDLIALGYVPCAQKKEQWHPYFQDGDRARAQSLFQEALTELDIEFSAFPQITVAYNTSDMWRRVMQAIQEQWREVLGVRVQLENSDWPMHLERMKRGNYQIARSGRFADYDDSLAFLKAMLSYNVLQNYCRWENKQYDGLIHSAETSARSEDRMAYLEQAESLLMEEMPIAPLMHGNAYSICCEDLKGVFVSPLYSVDFSHAYFERKDAP